MTRILGHRARPLGVIVACAATVASLAACSSGGATSTGSGKFSGQTLTVQHGPITSNASGFNDYYNALATAFHKATGATLKWETSSIAPDQQFPQIQASHTGPDVLGSSTSASAYNSGVFVKLSKADWNVLGGTDQFNPGQLGDSGPSGGPYDEVPQYNNPYALVYNTQLFAKAGITHPPTTWTEFIQDAQKINDPSQGVYGTGFDPGDSANQDSWKTPFYLIGANGGRLYSTNGKPQIDSSESVDAYSFWFSWYTKYHIVDPKSLSWQNPQMVAAFAAGKIGMLPAVNGSVALTAQQGAIGKNYAFAPIPTIPYGQTQAPTGGSASRLAQAGWYIGTYAPKDLALQFLKVTLQTDMQTRMFNDIGYLPVTKAGVTAVLQSKNIGQQKPFLEELQSSQEPEPFVSWWNEGELSLVSMGSQLASQLATKGSLSDSQIKSALKSVQSSLEKSI